MNIFFTPAIDILIFTLVSYAIAYYLYIRICGKDFAAVASADIKVSLSLLLIVSAYYYNSGASVNFFGKDIHWFLYYLFISGVIEILFFILYKKITKISWKEIAGK